MKILETISVKEFPFEWANFENYRQSDSHRVEIYLKEEKEIVENLILLFHSLFSEIQDNIFIYNKYWWDFSLESWNIDTDNYDYSFNNKSEDTVNYLKMLINSDIAHHYSGSCKCMHWDSFLRIILRCITTHQAPYSPIFYSLNHNFFFYFHHSGSIGLYYKTKNDVTNNILKIASQNYIL